MRDGVIKFRCDWIREPVAVEPGFLGALGRWRSRLRAEGLVGVLPDGTGFGNLSATYPPPRDDAGTRGRPGGGGRHEEGPRSFLITGSGTGGLADLAAADYALVTDYDIEGNALSCRGLTRASSESLSHAAIYAARPDAGAVFHIHSRALWERWRDVLPTTEKALAYGTPEIARALGRLAREWIPGSRREQAGPLADGEMAPWGGGQRAPAPGAPMAIVMGGHRDGLILFGRDLDEAGQGALRLSRAR